MKRNFSIACNWDKELLDFVKGKKIYSMYGKLRDDFLGGGRSPHGIKQMSFDEIKEYIEQLHKHDIKFIYLMNSTCNSNLEYSSKFESQVNVFVKNLIDCGVDLFCVSNPFTAKSLKKNFPDISLEVSTLSFVQTPAQAQFWDELGVTEICLCQNINHDLEIIKAIRKSVDAELKILVNDPCIVNCPVAHFHANYWSHSKITHEKVNDYCGLYCSGKFVENAGEIVKSSFILPEDLPLYDEAGISHYKIVDRLMPTDFLKEVYNAYENNSYEGNVYDLFPFYRKLKEENPDFEIILKSQGLAEIREHIRNNQCRQLCGSFCNYCDEKTAGLYSSKNTDKVLDLMNKEMRHE